jgi:CRP/FNR family transcriptional regulator, cyclic AMP receptor protein
VNLSAIDILGYCAAAAGFYAYYTNTMIPLRIAAIIGNTLYIPYATYKELYPPLVLNCALLILNIYRLWEIKHLISQAKEASVDRYNLDWLKPFMKPKKFPVGTILFRQGDIATDAYVIVSGSIGLPENNVTLGPGVLLGEMGMFTQGNKRTTSAYCKTDVSVLRISYDEFQQLYFQNPTFGLYLIRLIVQRMEVNAEFRRIEDSAMILEHSSQANG